MELVRDIRSSTRWTIRLLAGACVLLAVMCITLAVAWTRKSDQTACYRQALADGATPAVADIDCE
ncbi:MAG: hypothetical protein JHD15_16840 [Phenylobacterium sp.]|uniref:hypothetical protein n=1 Tax=Phenylobacterium sp. TaxID=1871053 RepID=UPI001A204D52|nr:hypothetical protein [Phenylobacterium sp.]MBJ7412013.1 hypothetical protein [Phenylobacterium sp.]